MTAYGRARAGRRRTRLVALCVAAVFAVFTWPLPAEAHNALIDSSPGDGKTVAEPPKSVVLTFNEPAIKTGTKVLVTGPGGSATAGGPKLVDNTVEQGLREELPAGEYTVEWRVTSADGHPITGTFSFRVRRGSSGAESAGPSAPAPAGSSSTPTPIPNPTSSRPSLTPTPTSIPTPTSTASDSPMPTEANDGTGASRDWWWLLAIIPIGLAVVLGWRFSRRTPG